MNEHELTILRQGYQSETQANLGSRMPSIYNLPARERHAKLSEWANMHPEFRVLPEPTRSVERERERIEVYLSREYGLSPSYEGYLEALAEMPGVSPMTDECRIAVNIPAHMEGEGIYKTLEIYTRQTDKDGNPINGLTWEINILDNNRVDIPFDNTRSEVERFLADNAGRFDLPTINYIQQGFDSPFNNTGNARKIATDLTLVRSLKRTNQTAPLYIETEDADLESVDPLLVHNAVTKLDEHPELDFVLGVTDRTPAILMKNDFVFLKSRTIDFTAILLRNKKYRNADNPNFSFSWNRLITNGWLCAYSAEAYAVSGGYDPLAHLGQDLPIGEALSVFRSEGDFPNLDLGARVSTRGDSSPRRIISGIAKGMSQYGIGKDKSSELNAAMREENIDTMLKSIDHLARIADSNVGEFEKALLKRVGRVRNEVPPTEYRKYVKMLFMFLGFQSEDYEVGEEGDITISSWGNVKNCLEDYRRRHIKPGKPGERTKYSTI
jgi:hypothetical protein